MPFVRKSLAAQYYMTEPRIDINRLLALSERQIVEFERDGFIKLKEVFNAHELEYFGAEITRLTLALNTQTLPMEERSTYDRAFLQVMNLWEHSDVVRNLVFGRRLAGMAAGLLRVRGVRLYHDQALYKEPGGGITPAHADQSYWPLASDRTITAWVPLQAVPHSMGPLAFYAGSHRLPYGQDLAISDESERAISEHMQRNGVSLVDTPFDLGEVSFHLGWTFHRAGANRSDRARAVMTVIYMDRDMRLKAPANPLQEADRAQWCAGARVGEVIATAKNPVLFES